MPLNIEVKAEPASIRGTTGWLRSTSGSVDGCGRQLRGARTQSEGGWTGTAGDGFRRVMGEVRTVVDELAGDLHGTAGALDRHATDLDAVKAEMAKARKIASGAGLPTTEVSIAEPGPAPAPAEPTPLPTDRPPTAGERQAHSAATELASAYAAEVRAYHQAADVVMRARQTEIQSQKTLLDHLESFSGKAPFTIAEIATGLAGHTAHRTSWYRRLADRWGRNADRAARLMSNPSYSAQTRLTAAMHHAENRLNEARVANKAVETRLARAVDRLPQGLKGFLGLEAGDLLDKTGSRVLSNAPRVLRGVPVAGTLIAAGGIGYDIATGRDPGKAVATGVSSFAAGAAVGMAIGGPVGLVAGAVVGAGVGYVVDEWGDEIGGAVAEAGDWVGDKAGDVFGGVAKGIGGIFD